MKVYVDRQSMKLLGIEKERPFYTGDSLSSTLTVYFNADVSESSVTLSFLLANGRTPRKNLIPDDNQTVTFNEEKFGQATWYAYIWNLTTKEGILTAPGVLQMTLALTTGQVVEQVQFTNNVIRTSRWGDGENIVKFGDDPEQVILDFATNIANINQRLSQDIKFSFMGEFSVLSTMYAAAFKNVYEDGLHLVTANFLGDLNIFMKSDDANEDYLFYVKCSDYKLYKLNRLGTKTEISETTNNKLSSWSQNPNYINYPSEKLVKDELDRLNVIAIVKTAANMSSYNTSNLKVDDKIIVLADETRGGATTICKWNGTGWELIGDVATNQYTKNEINSMLLSKVDKVTGKGLSTNDFDNNYKYLLDHPESNIVNTLTSQETSKALSAQMGYVLKGLIDNINTLLQSDDVDLDTLQEIVTYIKSNKSILDSVTTLKVNISDIIDNLTSEISNKPLSAKQGYVLKGLIDTLSSSYSSLYESVEGNGGIHEQVAANSSAILNKANLSYVNDWIDTILETKQAKIDDLTTIRSGAAAGATAVQPSALDSYYTKTQVDNLIPAAVTAITDAEIDEICV